MYAVIHKNKVIIGPKEWDRAFYSFRLKKLGVNPPTMPRTAPESLPYIIDSNTKIVAATITRDEATPMVQHLRGPIWTIQEDSVIAHYQAVDTHIDAARNNFREQAADERYKKETSGIKVVIQDIEVSIDTSREGRNIFLQKFSLMGDDETANWKFPEGWLTISKTELGAIIATGAAYIQSAFDWEKSIDDQIDAAETAEELLAIEIVESLDLNGEIDGTV